MIIEQKTERYEHASVQIDFSANFTGTSRRERERERWCRKNGEIFYSVRTQDEAKLGLSAVLTPEDERRRRKEGEENRNESTMREKKGENALLE